MLAAVLAEELLLLLQSVAELDILMQSEPVVELGLRSSDKFVGLSTENSKSLLLLPAAVGGLVLGSSVQHAAAQLMLKYLLQFGCVAHFEVCS